MPINIALWGSSKGMVKVPNTIGMTSAQALTAITAAGLTTTSGVKVDTADNNLNGKVAISSPVADTLVDYETNVELRYYNYVAPFSVFGFSPFGVFGFSPFGVFGFSPFGVFSFTPPFGPYGFSTTVYGVRCISGDTFIRLGLGQGTESVDSQTGKKVLINLAGDVIAKQAKDIQIGDEVLSAEYLELDTNYPDYEVFAWGADELTFSGHTTTTIVDIEESYKSQTIYFNDNTEAQFTVEHPILVKRINDDKTHWAFLMVVEIELGDIILRYDPVSNSYNEVVVEKIDIITNNDPVYTFSAEPADLIIAGNIVTHNK
jgi:hypothetical protein